MKKCVVTLLLLIIGQLSFCQDYDFGDVSKSELEDKIYKADTSANAVVLFRKKKINFMYDKNNGFSLVTHIHERVKFYKKEGFDHGSKTIWLYKNGSAEESISGMKAFTYTLQNHEIVKTKLGKEGIFKSTHSKRYDHYKFTMPGLQEGAVIEYKYRIISPFIYNIGRTELQDFIPIKKLDFALRAPEYFVFKRFTTGYLPLDLKESSENGVLYIDGQTIDHKVNTFRVTGSEIPAFKKEPFAGNINNYVSSIIFELSYKKFPNAAVKYYSTTWQDVSKTIYKATNFGVEFEKNKYYKEEIDALIKGVTLPREKLEKIFSFVQTKVKWNERNSLVTNSGVKEAYKSGLGNTAEINLMLGSMLKYAGLDTKLVMVGNKGSVTSLFPTIDGFNNVICHVTIPGQGVVLLDASDSKAQPNVLPEKVLQGSGRLINKNGSTEIVSLRPEKQSTGRYVVQYTLKEDGEISGKARLSYFDYLAYKERVQYGSNTIEEQISLLKEHFDLVSLTDYKRSGITKFGKGVTEQFDFKSSKHTEAIESEFFISPMLFFERKENPFKSAIRTYPIDFSHSFSYDYMVNLEIPEGYEVVEIPKSVVYKLPDDLGSFTYRISKNEHVIQLKVTSQIKSAIIVADYYEVLKTYYNQMIKKEKEKIVLKKS